MAHVVFQSQLFFIVVVHSPCLTKVLAFRNNFEVEKCDFCPSLVRNDKTICAILRQNATLRPRNSCLHPHIGILISSTLKMIDKWYLCHIFVDYILHN
jgi:hypothetical protein